MFCGGHCGPVQEERRSPPGGRQSARLGQWVICPAVACRHTRPELAIIVTTPALRAFLSTHTIGTRSERHTALNTGLFHLTKIHTDYIDKIGRLTNSYQLDRCGEWLVILFSLPLIFVQRLARLRRIHTDHDIPDTLVSFDHEFY
jgi:hypothetical protein